MNIIDKIKENAKKAKKRIVLAEGEEERNLRAADIIIENGYAAITLLGNKAKKKEEREFSNDEQVTRATPRAWIALSDDDHTVLPANGVNYYVELYRHDVPASLHVYPTGGHGWGMLPGFRFHIEMLLELRAWLKSF